MKVYGVRLEFSEINLAKEEQAALTEYRKQAISVTELCNKLAQYGLQVIRLSDESVCLQMDVTNGSTTAILSFDVEL